MEVCFLKRPNIHKLRMLHWCVDQLVTEAMTRMDLTASQACIMRYLSHTQQPPCPRDVEQAFSMSHSCVSGLLSRLEKKGFIELRCDEKDRRCKRIFVLDKGRDCNDNMRAAMHSIEEQLTRGFTAEEEASFSEMLDRAFENMGGKPCDFIPKEETQTNDNETGKKHP